MVCRFDLVCEVDNECGGGVVWELYDSVTVDVDCVTVSANCNLQLHCMFDACMYFKYRKFLFLLFILHTLPLYFYFLLGLTRVFCICNLLFDILIPLLHVDIYHRYIVHIHTYYKLMYMCVVHMYYM